MQPHAQVIHEVVITSGLEFGILVACNGTVISQLWEEPGFGTSCACNKLVISHYRDRPGFGTGLAYRWRGITFPLSLQVSARCNDRANKARDLDHNEVIKQPP